MHEGPQSNSEEIDVNRILEEAVRVGDAINHELARIHEEKGETVWRKYFNETFFPMRMTREELYQYAVYHVLIRSTPPWFNNIEVDLPGEDTLLAFATAKLEELKRV